MVMNQIGFISHDETFLEMTPTNSSIYIDQKLLIESILFPCTLHYILALPHPPLLPHPILNNISSDCVSSQQEVYSQTRKIPSAKNTINMSNTTLIIIIGTMYDDDDADDDV